MQEGLGIVDLTTPKKGLGEPREIPNKMAIAYWRAGDHYTGVVSLYYPPWEKAVKWHIDDDTGYSTGVEKRALQPMSFCITDTIDRSKKQPTIFGYVTCFSLDNLIDVLAKSVGLR